MEKIKLGDLIASRDALGRLAAQKLPIKVAYRLQKALRKIRPELDAYDEAHNGLVKELGSEVQPGAFSIRPGNKNWPKYLDAENELLDEDIELDIQPLKLSDLGEIQITAGDLLVLDYLLKGDENENPV